MLVGLDDIAWHELEHAYGPATDVPGLIRAAASPDGEVADDAIGELYGSVVHQGSVYPVTPVVLPFLLDIVANPAAHHRAALVGLLGVAADGDHDGAVRAVLRRHTERLLALLADDDEKVREYTAYTLGFVDGVPVSRLRWDVEEVPAVRATILPAAYRLDPVAAGRWLGPAMAEAPPVRAAAAFLVGTNGLPWSPAATDAVVTAHADGNPLENWAWHHSWLSVLMTSVDGPVVRDVVAALRTSPHREVRQSAVFAAGDAMREKRSLPPVLVPLLAPLLADPDESVRRTTAGEIAGSGVAALAADELAALAAHPEAPANPRSVDPRARAVRALVTIGDPRWRAFAGRYFPDLVRTLSTARVPVDDELLALARTGLAAGDDVVGLVTLIGTWGPAARAALPEVLAAFDRAERVAPATLRAIAPDAREVRERLAAATDNPRAALVRYELTGDPAPLVEAVRADLTADTIAMAETLGEAARPLLPDLTALMGREGGNQPVRKARLAAARLHWTLEHDPAAVLPTVLAGLREGGPVAHTAATAGLDHPDLVPALENLLTDTWAGVAAATALWRLTGRVETAPAIRVLHHDGPRPEEAVGALVAMRATDTVDLLTELADRDRRVVRHGAADEIITKDERLRERLRAAAAALR